MFEEKPLRQNVINSKYPKKIKFLNKVSSKSQTRFYF